MCSRDDLGFQEQQRRPLGMFIYNNLSFHQQKLWRELLVHRPIPSGFLEDTQSTDTLLVSYGGYYIYLRQSSVQRASEFFNLEA